MLQATSCHRLVFQETTEPTAIQVQQALASLGHSLELFNLSSLRDIITNLLSGGCPTRSSPLPDIGPRPAIRPEYPFLYLHSSGSTGLPRSVPFQQRQMIQGFRRCGYPHHHPDALIKGYAQVYLALRGAESGLVLWDYPHFMPWDYCCRSSSRSLPGKQLPCLALSIQHPRWYPAPSSCCTRPSIQIAGVSSLSLRLSRSILVSAITLLLR